MTKVGDIMVEDVVAFKPSDPIHYVAWSLRSKRISGAPVVDGRSVVGVVSERDIMRLLEEKKIKINLFLPSPLDVVEFPLKMKKELKEIAEVVTKTAKTPVEEIMTKRVFTVTKDIHVGEAAKIMGSKKINRLPVVDDKGDLIGIVTRGDVIGTLV
ncbi:MAG: CBS domain-containing protein [Candidatus Hydrothermarchaeaceae archaeon]